MHLDLVGPKAALISVGCSLSFIAPLTGAYLFVRNPVSLWHFNLFLVSIQCLSFCLLLRSFSETKTKDYKYQELIQNMEEIDLQSASEDEL